MSINDIKKRSYSCGDIMSQSKKNIFNSSEEEIEQQKEINKSNDNLQYTDSIMITPVRNNFVSIKSKLKRREREIHYESVSKSPNISDFLKKMTYLKLSPPVSSIDYCKNDDYFKNYD